MNPLDFHHLSTNGRIHVNDKGESDDDIEGLARTIKPAKKKANKRRVAVEDDEDESDNNDGGSARKVKPAKKRVATMAKKRRAEIDDDDSDDDDEAMNPTKRKANDANNKKNNDKDNIKALAITRAAKKLPKKFSTMVPKLDPETQKIKLDKDRKPIMVEEWANYTCYIHAHRKKWNINSTIDNEGLMKDISKKHRASIG